MSLFGSLLGSVTDFFGGQNQKHAAKNIINTYSTVGKQATDQYNNALTAAYQLNSPTYDVGLGNLRGASDMLQPGYDFKSSDPSYQWRLNQGLDAVQRSAAAGGSLNSGGTLKALNDYAQGAASQEYQNEFARKNTLAGYLPQATSNLTQANYNTAGGISNALFKMADGLAGGYQGKANALNTQNGAIASGVGQIGSAIGQYFHVPGF